VAGHEVERLVLTAPFVLEPELVPASADLVVLGNPTNPTSVLHPAAVLAQLRRPGRLLVVDEAFGDCVPGESESLADAADLTGVIVVRSLTKTWGLAGLRVGYVLAAADVIAALRAVQHAWPVSAPALAACIATCEPAAVAEAAGWAAELSVLRAELAAQLDALPGVYVVPAASASFLLVQTAATGLRERLHQHGFAVRRGETFPGLDEHWIRVAVRDRETNRNLVTALTQCLSPKESGIR
jgi:histidinol-phosphate aminotransferase